MEKYSNFLPEELTKYSMKTYLGESGLDKSWQKDFERTALCPKCGGEARIMFVASEGFDEEPEEYVTDLHKNEGKGGYWPHDSIACAVYLCQDCFEPVAVLNQA